MSGANNLTLKNPTFDKAPNTKVQTLPEKIIALVHFGRSGTGLLHSLIDGHQKSLASPAFILASTLI